jgi:hypothetical protein
LSSCTIGRTFVTNIVHLQNYPSDPAQLPIALICTNFIFRLIDPVVRFSEAEESTFCLRFGMGLQKTNLKQDVVFTALFFLRRLAHFHGPSLGPLNPLSKPVWFTFVAALHLASGVLNDHYIKLSSWIQIFPDTWDDPRDPITPRPKESLMAAQLKLREAKELFCDAIHWDLTPHSQPFFDPFKAALIAHFEGTSPAGPITDVTSRCIFYRSGLDTPELANYECKCSRINPSPGPHYTVRREVDKWMDEDMALFPIQSAAARCLTTQCRPRLSTNLHEIIIWGPEICQSVSCGWDIGALLDLVPVEP